MVNEEGETVINYRKNFLHGTDQTWALEGPGFFCEEIEGLGKVCVGVGMDLKYVDLYYTAFTLLKRWLDLTHPSQSLPERKSVPCF